MTASGETARLGLTKALRPRSVAVLGASNDVTRISGRPLHYMKQAGYRGAIYPVNNRRDIVQDLRAYPTLADVPDVPDVALIALAAALTREAVQACVDKGIGAAVVYAAGFAELSEDGRVLQDEIVAIARAGGMKLFGPNCLGMLNAHLGFIGTFSSAFDDGAPRPGPVAIISQSGAYAGHVAYLCRARNMGIGYWISTGNEADADIAECIAWLAEQDDVSVIMAYAEGVRDGARFLEALRIAHERRKPVVMCKVGVSSVGATAAQSHTASLAGSDAVYDALFRQYGVHRCHTTEEHVDVAYACARGVYPAGRRLGIVTISGGFGIQLCDAAERDGLDVAPLAEAAHRRLKEINPLGGAANPCDTTSTFLNDMNVITQTFRTMYEEGAYDSVIGSFTVLPGSPTYGERIKQAIREGTEGHLDRPTLLCMAAAPEVERAYDEAGFLVFPDSSRATRALAGLAALREGFESDIRVPQVDRRLARELGAGPMSEAAAQTVLTEIGVPFLPSRVVASAREAGIAATALGLPAAMKLVSSDIPHKTEIGGVMLDVAGVEAAEEAYVTLISRATQNAPHARVEGVLVTPMAPLGVETIIGVIRDSVFGPVVMFGLGGIFTEIFHDVAFRLAPFDRGEAHRMIRDIRGYPLLAGFRGRPAADIEALAETLCLISQFAAANPETIETIDLNPVLVREAGAGVLALDALIVPRMR